MKDVGLTDTAINAAWPTWWSDDADASSSARAELRFSLARKLGLDPRSLLEDDHEPRFVWKEEARFKRLSGENDLEQSAIASFGVALGSLLIGAAPASYIGIEKRNAPVLRSAILKNQPYVRLVDLLSLSWAVGIPIIHQRIFPLAQKRMSAMTVHTRHRTAILLGKDSQYPAHIAFYVAHELAHIALGHLEQRTALVDLDSEGLSCLDSDPEEAAADRFALELLTGESAPKVLPMARPVQSTALAKAALDASVRLKIEPGTLAFMLWLLYTELGHCYGRNAIHLFLSKASMA